MISVLQSITITAVTVMAAAAPPLPTIDQQTGFIEGVADRPLWTQATLVDGWLLLGGRSTADSECIDVLHLPNDAVESVQVLSVQWPRSEPNGHFGKAMSLDGSMLAVGYTREHGRGEARGTVFMYDLKDGQWQYACEVVPSVRASADRFGSSIALSGRTLVVGSPGQERVFIFERSNTGWKETAALSADDPAATGLFGRMVVALENGIAICGYRAENNMAMEGQVHVYMQSEGGEWTCNQVLRAPSEGNRVGYAESVAYHAGVLAIAGAREESGIPCIHTYDYKDGSWRERSSKIVLPQNQHWISPTMCGFDSAGRVIVGCNKSRSQRLNFAWIGQYEYAGGEWRLATQHNPRQMAAHFFDGLTPRLSVNGDRIMFLYTGDGAPPGKMGNSVVWTFRPTPLRQSE